MSGWKHWEHGCILYTESTHLIMSPNVLSGLWPMIQLQYPSLSVCEGDEFTHSMAEVVVVVT